MKPYVERGKNDAADAEAIREAVTRPTIRFVGIKTPDQQAAMMLHKVRRILTRQRTQLANALLAHMAEFGITAAVGRAGLDRLLAIIADDGDTRIPADARMSLTMLAEQLAIVKQQILANDQCIMAHARRRDTGRRLMAISGIRPLLASAFVASEPDPSVFATGRDLSAWIGLTPRQNSSGNAIRPGAISRAGDRYLREILIVGAMAVIRYAKRGTARNP